MQRRFKRVLDEHGSRLRHLALMLLGRQDEADDIVQDVMIKLWRNDRMIENGNELPWLLTCTRNACLDRLRSRSRNQGLLLRLVGEQASHSHSQQPEAPDEMTDRERRQRMLLEAIAQLPEPGRSLLILRDLQDLNIATTARTLDLNENQVKVYTFRARRALRKQLEEELHEQVA